jgi:hypothetical protein
MLKKLSLKAKEKLLKGYNQVWEGVSFVSGRMDWGPSGPGLAAWKRQE